MVYDIQKAGFWKRLSAWFLDVILVLILSVGMALVLGSVLHFNDHYDAMVSISQKYAQEAGISFDLTQEEYAALPEAERAILDAAYEKFTQDEEAVYAYNMVVNLSLMVASLSIFLSYLALEFFVPMFFKNGQTVGKKVFGLAVVRVNCVKVDGVCLFIRSILGKYTIETMVPVMLVIMVVWNILGIVGPIVIALLGLLQLILLFATQNHSLIHDCLANTVVVDLHSQMIFGNESELIDYKKRIHEDLANRSNY